MRATDAICLVGLSAVLSEPYLSHIIWIANQKKARAPADILDRRLCDAILRESAFGAVHTRVKGRFASDAEQGGEAR